MKIRWALLLTALFLFTLPLLGFAHGGGRYDDGPRSQRGWEKSQHDHGHPGRAYGKYQHGHHDDWRRHKASKEWKKHLRQHRHEHYRELRRDHRRERHLDRQRGYRHHADGPTVIWGTPQIVFRIDW